ncbi:MAG: CHAT domain-containing protein [Bacteroidia bacterium]|nr:CHAT domain-containing protein [Bacteroidia bacterium]MDW8235465.1 CHAT domain-containing protein [Bacteroidia bacterium]
MHYLLLIGLLWGQVISLPEEKLYFQGKVRSFAKKASQLHKKLSRRSSAPAETREAALLADALGKESMGRYAEADSLLSTLHSLPSGGKLPPELLFRYHWIKARISRGRGLITPSYSALKQALPHANAPWQKLLIGLEVVENHLLLGNTSQAADTLRTFPITTEEPHATYLNARRKWLEYQILWQQGKWDSLPKALPKMRLEEHEALWNTEYAYRRALAAILSGQKTEATKYLSQSKKMARKTSHKGEDFALRAGLLALREEFYQSSPGTYGKRLTKLTPFTKALEKPDLPLSYATAEALDYYVDIALFTKREALAEKILNKLGPRTEGIRAARLLRTYSRLARSSRQTRAALVSSQQALAQTFSAAPYPSVEHAFSYVERGEVTLSAYCYGDADSAFHAARQILSVLGEPLGVVTLPIWEALGRRALRVGDLKEAEAILWNQHRTLRTLSPTPTTSPTYLRNSLQLSEFFIRISDLPHADSLLKAVEKPIRNLPFAYIKDKIALEDLLGDLRQGQGDFRASERHYNEAMRLRVRQRREFGGQEEESGTALLRLAMLYQYTGRLSHAREIYDRITKLYQSAKREDPEVASYYVGLTDFYVASGDYLKAEESAQKARELTAKLQGENSLAYVGALLASARVEQALGRYDRQSAHLRGAEAIQRKLLGQKASLSLARTYYLLAENAVFRGKKDTVIYYLQLSERQADPAQSSAPLEYASLSLSIGGIWLGLDSLESASFRILQAQQVLEAQVPKKHPERLRALLYQARLRKAQQEYAAALHDYKKWITLWTGLYGKRHPEYPFYLAEIADCYWLARDFSAAKQEYDKAVELLLKSVDQLFAGLSESEKTLYWVRVRRVLEHYYAFSFLQGTPSAQLKAYEVYLATKAYILSETAQLRARVARSRDTTLQRLFAEWQDQKEFVVKLYAYPEEELKSLGINLAEEEAHLNELEKKFTALAGDIRMYKPSWKQLHSALSQNTAAVDWIRLRLPLYRSDSVIYYAVVTTPALKEPLFIPFPEGRRMEGYGFFRYTQSIMNFEKDTTSYRIYWSRVAEKLPPQVNKLIISPDGVYNQINIATIPLPQGGYVADKYMVIYHSRLASLTKAQRPARITEGRRAYLIADPDYSPGMPSDSSYLPPLPGTLEEAKAIREILQSQGILTQLYLKQDADESRLYQLVSPYILHIATHGLFLPYDESLGALVGIQSGGALANPLFRSALLLVDAAKTMVYGSSDVSRDGIANSYELLSMQLDNTELVALSACETGLGDIQNGEGVYGLQRAFLLAGARNLILSLWKVEDKATRDFMIQFYGEWLRKKVPIEEAFWNTQRAMRTQYASPYFWGAFILVRP